MLSAQQGIKNPFTILCSLLDGPKMQRAWTFSDHPQECTTWVSPYREHQALILSSTSSSNIDVFELIISVDVFLTAKCQARIVLNPSDRWRSCQPEFLKSAKTRANFRPCKHVTGSFT